MYQLRTVHSRKKAFTNNGADEPKVEGFSQGVARMCEGERHEDDEQEDGGAHACPFRF